VKRPEYINAFMEDIKWSVVSKRFAAAVPSFPEKTHVIQGT